MRGFGICAARRSISSIDSNRRCVVPSRQRVIEAQHGATVSALLEAVVGERWARASAYELFEALALLRAESDATVQVEAIHACAQLAAKLDAFRCGREVPREEIPILITGRPSRAESDTLRDRTFVASSTSYLVATAQGLLPDLPDCGDGPSRRVHQSRGS
jgi:hypothetical protein